MKYDELDDKAKARARDWYREGSTDHDWWDSVYEDAVHIGKLLGIEISTRTVRLMRGTREEPEISFQGFYSQGDGCCFSGEVKLHEMQSAVERTKEHAAGDEELMKLAALAESIHGQFVAHQTQIRLVGGEATGKLTLDVAGSERYWRTKINDVDLSSEESDLLLEPLNTLVSAFADWIYEQLEAEYGHLTSDETVEEAILANDYDFDEEGRM